MRFMGDASASVTFFQPGANALDPAMKAQLLAAASSMPDDRASDLADLSDATPYGSRQRLIRIGIGAGLGLVVGLVVGRATKKR